MKLMNNEIITDVKKLRVKTEKVDVNDEALLIDIRNKLLDAFYGIDRKAQGISAVQVGLCYNAALFRFKKDSIPIVWYNLKPILKVGFRASNEGCLSEGNGRWIVARPWFMVASYDDVEGRKHTVFLPYKKARIFMHEYDHSNGILLQDKGVRVG